MSAFLTRWLSYILPFRTASLTGIYHHNIIVYTSHFSIKVRYGLVARICRSHSRVSSLYSAGKARVRFPVSEYHLFALFVSSKMFGCLLRSIGLAKKDQNIIFCKVNIQSYNLTHATSSQLVDTRNTTHLSSGIHIIDKQCVGCSVLG